VNGELRAVVVNLNEALDADKVVAVESLHDLGHVVPHLGLDVAGAIAQQQRQVRLARLFLPDFLGVHDECGHGRFVGLDLIKIGLFMS
jgi:hypothetical protein